MRSALPSSSELRRPPLLLKTARQVSRVHRWLGIVLCLFFAIWFATGTVMMYVPFPSLSDADRIAASEALDLEALHVTPGEAVGAASAAGIDRLTLVSVLGSPRYVMTLADGRVLAVADGRATAPLLDSVAARKVAERFSTRPVTAIDGPFDHDQWVVHQRFDASRPFFRATVGDPAGTELYVSARSGEVLQRTTTFERGWNWVGAVVHWIYPTVLRKNFWAWDQTVWWLALVGLSTASMGMGLGVVRLVNLRRKQGPGVSPFRGWMRWHHVLGLTAGTFVLTWVFSGWLSMDHGRLFSLEIPQGTHEARLRGMPMADAVRGISVAQLQALGDPHEIEFTAVGSEPWLVLRGGRWGASTVIAIAALPDLSKARPLLPDALLLEAVRNAWAPEGVVRIAPIAAGDAYGRLRNNPLPETTRRVTLANAGETWVHVDAASGRLISVMDRSRRLLRWLFDGLHTFDFPFLNGAGPLWQILMWLALVLGFVFSVTGVVLGSRRLAKSSRSWLRPHPSPKESS